MFKTSICFTFISASLCVYLVNVQPLIYVADQQGLAFTPFKIKLNATDDSSQIFTLTYNCSAPNAADIRIGSSAFDFCNASPLNGTAADINAKLQSIPVISKAVETFKPSIKFSLFDASKNKIAASTTVLQPLFSIPVQNKVTALQMTPPMKNEELTDHSYTIATIDPVYCSSFGSNGLKLILEPSSDVFVQSFANCQLTLTVGGADAANFAPVQFSATITDTKTNLASDPWLFLATQSTNTNDAFSRFDFWIFVSISVAIIFCFVMMLCYANSKANQYERAKRDTNEVRLNKEDIRNHTIEMKPNVLSDSILTWNQQLMAKHQHKNLKTQTNFEKNTADILTTKPAQKFEMSSEADNNQKTEEREKPFEDISEINSSGFHRSLRFDENKKEDSFFGA